MNQTKKRAGQSELGAVIVLAVLLVALIGGAFWGFPKYRVWSSGQAGEAELAQASYNRRIGVQEAQAKLDSAKLLASAEVERAKGVAQANQIIGTSLKGNDEYLRYLWIDKLSEGTERETIYVPTEAGLPILEAGKRGQRAIGTPPTP